MKTKRYAVPLSEFKVLALKDLVRTGLLSCGLADVEGTCVVAEPNRVTGTGSVAIRARRRGGITVLDIGGPYPVELTTTHELGPGRPFWTMTCPLPWCRRSCRKLYRPRGGGYWACNSCWHVATASRQTTGGYDGSVRYLRAMQNPKSKLRRPGYGRRGRPTNEMRRIMRG